jgi:hypothetical protein
MQSLHTYALSGRGLGVFLPTRAVAHQEPPLLPRWAALLGVSATSWREDDSTRVLVTAPGFGVGHAAVLTVDEDW